MRFVAKRWGSEEIFKWVDYGVKLITLAGRTSMHMHPKKVETIMPLRTLEIEWLKGCTVVQPGDCVTIPAGTYHRMIGPSLYWEASTCEDESERHPAFDL